MEAKRPLYNSFTTSSGENTFPFMHTYIPGLKTLTDAMAYPRLNRPSEEVKPTIGIMAPVNTMVLLRPPPAS